MRPPYTKSDEKKILDTRLKDFMGEVNPVDLLPYLPCLEQMDKEAIEAKQNNMGPTTANQILVDRLKRRNKGFVQFVRALRTSGNEHTALLVDPYYIYPSKPVLCLVLLWCYSNSQLYDYILFSWRLFGFKLILRSRIISFQFESSCEFGWLCRLNGMKLSIISQTVTDYLTISSHHNCLCLALSCLWKSVIPP